MLKAFLTLYKFLINIKMLSIFIFLVELYALIKIQAKKLDNFKYLLRNEAIKHPEVVSKSSGFIDKILNLDFIILSDRIRSVRYNGTYEFGQFEELTKIWGFKRHKRRP